MTDEQRVRVRLVGVGSSYSSMFPADPPDDHEDPVGIAVHDQAAFERVERMLCHWDRPHRRSYHWMITLDEHEPAHALSRRCQQLLPAEGLDLVPPESLHLTVRRLGYVDEVPVPTLRAAARAVGEHCRGIEPFRLQLIPLAGSPGAVRFSVAPWSPLLGVYRAVSTASGYADIDPLRMYRPHVGIAYSNRVQSPEEIIRAVRRARELTPVEVTITELRLVELTRADHHYTWHVLERFPTTGNC
ncbi:2'-5' RNA ligase [Actinopolyspora alba]|uniref:2'-5' RNA ligase n=1 Tax=Actinopolyspora alba TaxID=673379 RepID=A0A1I1YV47_9ACTN|nr:2'-5' RNA ligase family protein [Actinopolyspora alba]SFE22858.1 2'-5' RNA ligase [Actinopolyspora alba]